MHSLNTSVNDTKDSYRVKMARKSSKIAESYKVRSYKVGDRIWLNGRLFIDAYSKCLVSEKLC